MEDSEWEKILVDDEYRQTTHPHVDDLVIYKDPRHGYLHVGRIVEMRTFISRPTPWVLSKWGPAGGEAFHWVHDHGLGDDVISELWTDRKVNDNLGVTIEHRIGDT